MRFHNITKEDMVNGEGVRVVLWTSGCAHGCKGCQNQVALDHNGGLEFDQKAKDELFQALDKKYISGITFSGGDPLFLRNRDKIKELACEIKEKLPKKNIWLYTGYTWEEIQQEESLLDVIKFVDIVVDGKFKEDLKDNLYHWAGSTNQRVIDVEKSLKSGEVVLYVHS